LLRDATVIERVTAEGQTTITQRYTEEAVRFIEANRERRFFLYLPHSAVHFPLYPGLEFRGKSGNGLFSDWVTEVDWSVGEVLDTVRSLNLENDTLVIFTSDNGGALNHGASNKPLRGSKGQTWEGGIRVPTIAWWPGVVPANSSTAAITSHMDWLPTFAALTGVDLTADRKLDGVDLSEVLRGEATTGPRDVFHYFRGFDLQAIRRGPWKLHLQKRQLFHLERDIAESNDVADAHPEVVAELQRLAAEMDADLGTKDAGPGCRPAGRVDAPLPLIGMDGTIRSGFAPR
jgi:arylsulfatase A-like enzyme